jgi:hypothetical protein
MFGNMIGKGYTVKRHDGNEYGIWRICHQSAYKLNQWLKKPNYRCCYEIPYEGKDAKTIFKETYRSIRLIAISIMNC